MTAEVPIRHGGFEPTLSDEEMITIELCGEFFKLGWRLSRAGLITHFPLLPARPHDIQLLDDLAEGFAGVVPSDQRLLAEQGVVVITPPRRNMTATHPPPVGVFLNLQLGRPALDLDGLLDA